MSDKDDPFGSGGKTVIRPNPAGRARPDPQRPAPMQPPAAPPAQGARPGGTVAGVPP